MWSHIADENTSSILLILLLRLILLHKKKMHYVHTNAVIYVVGFIWTDNWICLFLNALNIYNIDNNRKIYYPHFHWYFSHINIGIQILQKKKNIGPIIKISHLNICRLVTTMIDFNKNTWTLNWKVTLHFYK